MTSLLDFMRLFTEFRAPSWDGWRDVLARITPETREFYAVIGRGGGKSRVVALLATWFASRPYPRVPGEYVYVGVLAPDKRQAGVTFRYVVGLLQSVPVLSRLIVSETRDSVELANGVIIEVVTANIAAPRGRAYALAIVEEAAFLPTDQSANPDIELLRAIRPALARVPGSLLAVVSSPYARRGVLWAAAERHRNNPASDVVFVQAPTLDLNPTFDAAAVEKAYAEDPASAAAEFGAQFRSDVETFVSRDAIEAVVVPERFELPWVHGVAYQAFLDFAGGGAVGHDSAALCIAHAEARGGRTIGVLDLIRERRPPFSPELICVDFAGVMKAYGLTSAVSDRWAGMFPVEQMAKHGIRVDPSERTKSDIYRELLPLINSGGLELLDEPRLAAQLAGLERRTARGGRDSIDHAPGGHDDVINAAAGALVLAALTSEQPTVATIVANKAREGWQSVGPGSASLAMTLLRQAKSAQRARELAAMRPSGEQFYP